MKSTNPHPNTLIFLGPQGSGKGTQAELLSKKFGYFEFSTGDLMRELSQQNTELGRKVKATIDAGHLVEPELISQATKDQLQKLNPGQAVIIDGYPRSPEQLEYMREFLPELGREDFLVLYFDITEAETIKRLKLRAQKEGRADDTKDAIEKRLEHFRQETLPMVNELEREGRVVRVDGMPSVEQIHQDVVSKLSLA